MIKDRYVRGIRAALEYMKLGNMQLGAAGYNPSLTGQAGQAATTTPAAKPPMPASPAIAAGAMKSKVLG